MRLKQVDWVAKAPVIIAAVCGWIFSAYVEGHHPSSSSDWFNLQAFDPIAFLVQDVFIATMFVVVASVLFKVLRYFAPKLVTPDMASTAASLVASIAVLVWSCDKFITVRVERAAHEVVVRKQMAEDDRQTAAWLGGAKASFDKLGWVRYPNLRKDYPGVKGGFQINGASASFMPADDPETVGNYFLSRCESWQDDGVGIMIVVRNDGEPFQVFLLKHEPGPDTVLTTASSKIIPLAHTGTTTWAIANPGQSSQETGPATPPPPTPHRLAYPGAASEMQGESKRLWTPDEMDKVLVFYRSAGAQQTDNAPDADQNHTFSADLDGHMVDITLSHVFQTDGTKGTLIVISPG